MNEKLCVFCKHWYFDGGAPHYSDLTPGEAGEMKCNKGRWSMIRITTITERSFRKLILNAEHCDLYQQASD